MCVGGGKEEVFQGGRLSILDLDDASEASLGLLAGHGKFLARRNCNIIRLRETYHPNRQISLSKWVGNRGKV